MKRMILLAVIFPFLCTYSQVKEIGTRTYFTQGNWEFNVSSNIGVGFSTAHITYVTQGSYPPFSSPQEYNSEHSGRPFQLLFSASIGYCIFDGLAIEPELDINLISDSETSVSLIGNLSYNFHIPKKNIYPFVKLGYGLSNYSSDYGYYHQSGSNSLDTKVFNAGAGLKFLHTSSTALKLEINYKNYSCSSSDSNSDQYYQSLSSIENNVNALSLSIGFSIVL